MKIGFDVGGVLSKYPDVFRPLLQALLLSPYVEVFIVSDMHPVKNITDMLDANKIPYRDGNVISADYAKYGEACKAVVCQELKIDLLIDDFPGYVGMPGYPNARLLMMPDATEPYYADNWINPHGAGEDFGRRKKWPL